MVARESRAASSQGTPRGRMGLRNKSIGPRGCQRITRKSERGRLSNPRTAPSRTGLRLPASDVYNLAVSWAPLEFLDFRRTKRRIPQRGNMGQYSFLEGGSREINNRWVQQGRIATSIKHDTTNDIVNKRKGLSPTIYSQPAFKLSTKQIRVKNGGPSPNGKSINHFKR